MNGIAAVKLTFWLRHCGSWFGFREPAKFVRNTETGGHFAGYYSAAILHSSFQNGRTPPSASLGHPRSKR